MKSHWRKYSAQIDAMAQRERVLLFLALIAVVGFIMNAAFIDPQTTRIKMLSARMAQQQTEMQAFQLKIKSMEQQLAATDASNRARRDAVKTEIDAIDGNLKDLQHKLVPAQNMKAVLQDMLARDARVQLVSMRTLPVTSLVEKKNEKPNAPATPAKAEDGQGKEYKNLSAEGAVFKHGVQITVQGSYSELYDYLARLEKLPWRMFWLRASLNAESYPRVTLTITVYTLSLDKAWLEV
jgi:MSHA biogenesis protein MshJ